MKKEDLGECRVKLGIVIDSESVESEYQSVLKAVAKEARHPGFRKGKVPLNVVEEKHAETLSEELISRLVPQSVGEAMDTEKLIPVSRPRIEEQVKFERGKEIRFETTFEVRPEVELKKYKGLSAERPVMKIADEEIDQTLQQLRERHAEFTPVEDRPAKSGDTVQIDFEGKMEGEAIEGGKAENYPLELGAARFIPGFEENVEGMKIGETKDFEVKFPDDYHAEHLQGKPVTFTVSLKGIKERRLAELDDEFAKDVSEFGSLDELKADIRKELEKVKDRQSEDEVKDQIAMALIEEHSDLVVPATLVEEEINRRLSQFARNLRMAGRTIEDYLAEEKKTMEQAREDLRDSARKTVIYHLISDTIATKEEITVSDEEVEAELARLAEQARVSVEQYRQYLEQQNQLDIVRDQIRLDKTMNLIIENAEIKEGKKAVK